MPLDDIWENLEFNAGSWLMSVGIIAEEREDIDQP